MSDTIMFIRAEFLSSRCIKCLQSSRSETSPTSGPDRISASRLSYCSLESIFTEKESGCACWVFSCDLSFNFQDDISSRRTENWAQKLL